MKKTFKWAIDCERISPMVIARAELIGSTFVSIWIRSGIQYTHTQKQLVAENQYTIRPYSIRLSVFGLGPTPVAGLVSVPLNQMDLSLYRDPLDPRDTQENITLDRNY